MAVVRWSERAANDLETVHQFIARDSPAAADATVSRISAAIDRLEIFPRSGRTLPEDLGGPYPQLMVGSYRAIYRADDAAAIIAAIVNARRPLDAALLD